MSNARLARFSLLTFLGMVLVSVVAGRTQNGFDLSDSLVPGDQIHLGGPPRDGIPAIDRPQFVNAAAADFLNADEHVLGLVINGAARAYPIAVLNWHEVVNDDFDGTPVSVTYCPLCGTGIAFSGSDGTTMRTFGVSGLLYNSDVLLYDRETESLWSQLMMRAISGPQKGQRLTPLPLNHTRWSAWRARHPDTRVLSRETGFQRDYDRDPYAGYAGIGERYFPVSAVSRRYHPKERVLGVELGGRFKAYPYTELALSRVSDFTDQIGDQPVRIVFDRDNETARAFDSLGKELPATSSFWFAWYAFHPDGEVFASEPSGRTAPRETIDR